MADRKFATWEWRGNGKVVKVDVRMRWGSDEAQGKRKYKLDDITKPEHAPTFFIQRDDEDLFIDLEHGNITELAEMLKAHLNEWYTIEWSDKLVVVVKSEGSEALRSYEQKVQQTSFEITVEEWSEGTQTKTGDVWSRKKDVGYGEKRYACNLKEAYGKTRHSWRREERGTVLGVVDDTPENRAALKAMEEQLSGLFAKIQQFLSGDQLQTSLSQAVLRQLMPPDSGV